MKLCGICARNKGRYPYSLFSSICLSWRSGICRDRMCPLTTSAHLSSDSMMFQGCERSTTIITVVCSMVSWVRTKGSNWLCQTTPSRIHTPMRSMKSAGGWGVRKRGKGKELTYAHHYRHPHIHACAHAAHMHAHMHTHTRTHTHTHTHTHYHTMCNDSV